MEKASGGCHVHDATELRFWNTCNVRNILQWNAATQGDTGQDLKLTQPLQTSQELVLQRFEVSSVLGLEEGGGDAYLRGELLEKVCWLTE